MTRIAASFLKRNPPEPFPDHAGNTSPPENNFFKNAPELPFLYSFVFEKQISAVAEYFGDPNSLYLPEMRSSYYYDNRLAIQTCRLSARILKGVDFTSVKHARRKNFSLFLNLICETKMHHKAFVSQYMPDRCLPFVFPLVNRRGRRHGYLHETDEQCRNPLYAMVGGISSNLPWKDYP